MVINKSVGHIGFGITGCNLYELVHLGGKEYEIYHISEILWPDTDKLSDEEMTTISKILNGEEK